MSHKVVPNSKVVLPTKAKWRARLRADQARAEQERPGCVEAHGYKVYSQSDEDGIIAEIFRRIGTTDKTFVEFGAEIGLESNCRLLLERGWDGLWIEGNKDYASIIQSVFSEQIDSGQLKFVSDFVSVDNINRLIEEAGFTGQIDLLSIDIDGNDYHVWHAITVIDPRVIVAEHNGYPPPHDWVMPYTPDFRWDGKDGGYGSSLLANARLARAKGYTLVGTGLYSPNGFYVRNDLIGASFPALAGPQDMWRPLDFAAIVNFPRRPIETEPRGARPDRLMDSKHRSGQEEPRTTPQ